VNQHSPTSTSQEDSAATTCFSRQTSRASPSRGSSEASSSSSTSSVTSFVALTRHRHACTDSHTGRRRLGGDRRGGRGGHPRGPGRAGQPPIERLGVQPCRWSARRYDGQRQRAHASGGRAATWGAAPLHVPRHVCISEERTQRERGPQGRSDRHAGRAHGRRGRYPANRAYSNIFPAREGLRRYRHPFPRQGVHERRHPLLRARAQLHRARLALLVPPPRPRQVRRLRLVRRHRRRALRALDALRHPDEHRRVADGLCLRIHHLRLRELAG
jgi:hypothetical protein